MRSRASIAIGPPQRSFNGRTRTYRRPLSTSHDLHRSDYWDQQPEHKVQAAHRHCGQRPPSLKKGGRTEARREPPRRFWHLARQRLGPDTSRGRQGARHPPLRGDSATPGRLPAGLRRRLDHDTQARCSRPARAFLPGPFALAQPASPAAAPGTGSSPEEEVRLDSLGGWCLRYTGAATCRGLLWPSRASRSKRVRLAGRPTHLPSTRSVRGGSSNARAMCDGRWCWRASGRSAPLVVAGTSLSRGRAPAYAS